MLKAEAFMAALLILGTVTGAPILGRLPVLWELWPGKESISAAGNGGVLGSRRLHLCPSLSGIWKRKRVGSEAWAGRPLMGSRAFRLVRPALQTQQERTLSFILSLSLVNATNLAETKTRVKPLKSPEMALRSELRKNFPRTVLG